jgi:hypothetical protein
MLLLTKCIALVSNHERPQRRLPRSRFSTIGTLHRLSLDLFVSR